MAEKKHKGGMEYLREKYNALQEKHDFLLKNCPFWVRNKYKREFGA